MKIITTNIGERKEVNWKGKLITTGIFKEPTNKPIFLDVEDVKGDTLCDRESHGGVDQAVYAYSLKHYNHWKSLYPNIEWTAGGMFGENLTIDDLDETKLRVGDTYKVGKVILEVTKPRPPCLKLGVKFKDLKILKQFWNINMCGTYFKVLKTGYVKAGDEFKQIKSCPENKTIAEIYEIKRIAEKEA